MTRRELLLSLGGATAGALVLAGPREVMVKREADRLLLLVWASDLYIRRLQYHWRKMSRLKIVRTIPGDVDVRHIAAEMHAEFFPDEYKTQCFWSPMIGACALAMAERLNADCYGNGMEAAVFHRTIGQDDIVVSSVSLDSLHQFASRVSFRYVDFGARQRLSMESLYRVV